ncbi:hypothetical protein L6164_023052 [Bauhinia variegata]|uniref:Uncharacterized protein n=1 Tax=Bauhinia variegata TaxID=167791 RepID=A0ACB9MIK1_BAUVA|nr:hypothetical protein L6164_023052 [Bauhinia variegata]
MVLTYILRRVWNFFLFGSTVVQVVERENGGEAEVREGNAKEEEKEEVKDLEKGEVGFEQKVIHSNNHGENHNEHEEFQLSRFNRLNPTNPLRIVVNSATRVAAPPIIGFFY